MNDAKDLARTARRNAILDVAEEIFLQEGYAAASMSAIAQKVGGSKATLYNYFSSKEDLFSACVLRRCEYNRAEIYSLAPDDEDFRAALTRLGKNYVNVVMSETNLRHFRLIAAEAERTPEFGQIFYETGPATGVRMFAELLTRECEKGRLRIDDIELAAHQFISMCQNKLLKARLCGALPEPSQEEVAHMVESAITVFLKAYAA